MKYVIMIVLLSVMGCRGQELQDSMEANSKLRSQVSVLTSEIKKLKEHKCSKAKTCKPKVITKVVTKTVVKHKDVGQCGKDLYECNLTRTSVAKDLASCLGIVKMTRVTLKSQRDKLSKCNSSFISCRMILGMCSSAFEKCKALCPNGDPPTIVPLGNKYL